LFYEHKRKQNDSVWKVKKEELKFSDPPTIIGRGTFGLVLLGEYRGTEVAVKGVIPPKKKRKKHESGDEAGSHGTRSYYSQEGESDMSVHSNSMSIDSRSINMAGTMSEANHIGKASWGNMSFGFGSQKVSSIMKSILSGSGQNKTMLQTTTEGGNRRQLRKEFIEEMRFLSKLRHPCITTVMGAVIDKKEEPMLVMEYMDHGSLHDILHNETMYIDGELLVG
jgi:serine/threonine protein kinase